VSKPLVAWAGLGMRPAVLALLLVAGTSSVRAEDAVETARALLTAWHEDPARIDRARTLLESVAVAEPSPPTLVELSRVWFLTGDFRAHSTGERLAAYERGRQAAGRARDLAQSEQAYLWYAINTGRVAELTGVMRAVRLVGSVRESSQVVLRINPSSVDGLVLAGGLAAELPGFMGGDREKAESYFARALELDPHKTGGRLELARLYMATRRWADARRELERILDDPAPSDLPRWTVAEAPRARALLAELGARGEPRGHRPGQESP